MVVIVNDIIKMVKWNEERRIFVLSRAWDNETFESLEGTRPQTFRFCASMLTPLNHRDATAIYGITKFTCDRILLRLAKAKENGEVCLIAWNIRDGHHTTLASKHVFFRSEKKTNRLTLFLFYGEYFHERRVIAEGKFLLNTFMVQT